MAEDVVRKAPTTVVDSTRLDARARRRNGASQWRRAPSPAADVRRRLPMSGGGSEAVGVRQSVPRSGSRGWFQDEGVVLHRGRRLGV
jgi:hypothetical protein